MENNEEKIKKDGIEEIDVAHFIDEKLEAKEDLTTIFAVRTTINQESNILKQIFYRFRLLDVIPDVKAILVSPLLPGYIFFEASQKRDVMMLIQGVPHIKGRIVGQIKLDEIRHVLVPRKVTEFLEEQDTVEIISGVFESSRAVVMRMPHDTSSSEEVVVRLLQEETPITIKIHGDYLKLVEKKKRVEEPIPEIRVKAAEEIMTDLDKMISFDDEFEEYEEGVTEDYAVAEIEEFNEDDDEDDDWSKFEGF